MTVLTRVLVLSKGPMVVTPVTTSKLMASSMIVRVMVEVKNSGIVRVVVVVMLESSRTVLVKVSRMITEDVSV